MKRVEGLTPAQAKDSIAAGALLLDVREEGEWEAGRIPGAVHIPLMSIPERVGELPKGRPIVCQCAHGVRSAAAAYWLVRAGFSAYNLDGGIAAWHAADLPVEQGPP